MKLPIKVYLDRLSLALLEVSKDIEQAQNAFHKSLETGKISNENLALLQKVDIANQESLEISNLIKKTKPYNDMVDIGDALKEIKLDSIQHIIKTGKRIEEETEHEKSFEGDIILF